MFWKYFNNVNGTGYFKYNHEVNPPTIIKKKRSCNMFYCCTELCDGTIFHTPLSWNTGPETDHSDNENQMP